ncbi:hypothetical protein FD723_41100 (plasmid) [Nostoc sp. C052]|uniref:hypothetical protein n=1 Tax=Nostoc sp. C052 TaxID=2576902 RepID=UPI0015C3ED05|nr:hypothetical protein [Nostoc sp. C052]QLE46607.1 hypothetical protein FD723_41100 [Nostoc sp. C052]
MSNGSVGDRHRGGYITGRFTRCQAPPTSPQRSRRRGNAAAVRQRSCQSHQRHHSEGERRDKQ